MKFQSKEICKKCNGHKVYSTESVSILSICNYCGGWGHVDWIDNMTGNPSPLPPDLVMKERVAMQNAQALMTAIKSILYGAGINVNVIIEKNQCHSHVHNNYIPPHNHGSVSIGKVDYSYTGDTKIVLMSI